jgi:putative oxidoreductase
MTTTVSLGLLILRVAVGLTLAAHGAQKLFGWFGGPGPEKMRLGLEKQGLRPATLWVGLAILGELGGGLSLAFGFLTPLGAAGALGAMVMAMRSHWKNGFFGSRGGFEYPLTLAVAGVALGIAGPGRFSLDGLFGIALPVAVFGALAVAALVTDAVGLSIVRSAATARPEAKSSPAA